MSFLHLFRRSIRPLIAGTIVASGLLFSILPAGAVGQPYAWTSVDQGGSSIASSADGMKLVTIYTSHIYTSTDRGQNWTLTSAPIANWQEVASSADGTKLIAVEWTTSGNPYAYLSTDSGQTWSQASIPTGYMQAVTSSANGDVLVVSVWGSGLYTSTDSGASWTQSSDAGRYVSTVASSGDGNTLVAAAGGGNIFISTDHGATWVPTTAPVAYDWISLASSTDGGTIIAAEESGATSSDPGTVFTSRDHGNTWTQTSLPSANWESVAASSDGTKLVAAQQYDGSGNPGSIYLSTDSGQTWTQTDTPLANWNSVAVSADASTIVVAQNASTEIGTLKSSPASPTVNPVIAGATAITGTATVGDSVEATFPGGQKVTALVGPDGTFSVAVPNNIMMTANDQLSIVGISADSGLTSTPTNIIVQAVDATSPAGGADSNATLAPTGVSLLFTAILGMSLIMVGGMLFIHLRHAKQ